MKKIAWFCAAWMLLLNLSPAAPPQATPGQAPIRIGIIGTDTSHCIEFTRILNDPSQRDHIPGGRMVAFYKGGSPDIESSAGRVDKFAQTLREKWNLEMVPDIETLCTKVDAVFLASGDGRKHLEQARPVFAARKPVFIDKPLAASYADARAIVQLAEKSGTPWFSSSSLRFYPTIQELKRDATIGKLVGCNAHGPSPTEPHHPDLFWYGIHGVEILYTMMGTGCQSVTRVGNAGTDVVVGEWTEGRIGVLRALRDGKTGYGAVAFGKNAIRSAGPVEGLPYPYLLTEMLKFFRTGVPPVPAAETLELIAFMQAADMSKARGGQKVLLSEVR